MKRILLSVATLAFIFGVTLTSCTKDDITSPVLSLNGSASVTLDLGDTYTDAGATANDDKDGDLTTSIVTTGLTSVNENQVGTYIIKYNVTDAAGNSATEVTRTVIVRADRLAGTYDVDCTISSGPGVPGWLGSVTLTASSTEYNKLIVSNFAGWGSSVIGYILVSGSNITVPSQHPTAVPSPNEGTASGTTGTYSVTGPTSAQCKISTINYSWTYDTGGVDACAETYTNKL
ncbi:MAG: DUF5011 domain-containing protein [Bacteroidota bacterium]